MGGGISKVVRPFRMEKNMRYMMAMMLVLGMMGQGAWAQFGVKDLVQRKLNEANETREEQAKENGVETTPVQQQASTVPHEDAGLDPVKISGWTERMAADGTTKVRLYFAHPRFSRPVTARFPAVLVLQEWWGVNEDMQKRVNDLAAKGYYAVAVDLYDGKVTADAKEAAEFKAGLTDAAALVRTKTGMDYLTFLAGENLVDRERMGVVGWCMGGEQALKLAVADERVKGTAIFYGPLITDAEKLKSLKGPVLGIFGKLDTNPSQEQVKAFGAALKANKTPVEIHNYDGVGHAFASKSAAGMGMYREAPAIDAYAKLYVWLNKTIKNPQVKPTTMPGAAGGTKVKPGAGK